MCRHTTVHSSLSLFPHVYRDALECFRGIIYMQLVLLALLKSYRYHLSRNQKTQMLKNRF